MKKIMMFLVAAAFCSLVSAQQDVWIDTFDFAEIVGADTVIWKSAPSGGFSDFGGAWSIDIKYDTLDADDATVSLGGGNHADSTWMEYVHTSLPFTLNVTTNTDAVNGVNKASVAFYGDWWPYYTVGVKVDPGNVTDSYLIIKWIQTY